MDYRGKKIRILQVIIETFSRVKEPHLEQNDQRERQFHLEKLLQMFSNCCLRKLKRKKYLTHSRQMVCKFHLIIYIQSVRRNNFSDVLQKIWKDRQKLLFALE